MSSRSAPVFVFASALRMAVNVVWGVIKSAWILAWRTGALWPAGYALYGLILYLGWGFEPFAGGVWSGIFIAGGVVCIMLFLIKAALNTVSEPKRAFGEGFKNPVWEKRKKTVSAPSRERRIGKPEENEYRYTEYRNYNNGSRNAEKPVSTKFYKPREKAKVYMSALEDRLIYEYPDRFEVYVVEDNDKLLERIEFKDIA